MAHMRFQEYLDAKNKFTKSPKVKSVADFEGKTEDKPGKEKMHKNAGGKGQEGTPYPYKAGKATKPSKDGLVHSGDKNLVYKPDTKLDYQKQNVSKSEMGVPGGKKIASWPMTKTQEWVDRTKKMSLAEFTKKVRSEALNNLDPSQIGSIQETVEICKKNKSSISNLVREMKRNGLFNNLMEELSNHEETYKAFANLMGSDEAYSRKLVKAMSEMVAPPIGGSDEDDQKDMGDEDQDDQSDDSNMDDEDHEEGDEDHQEGDDEGDMEDDMGDEDHEEGEEGDMGDHEEGEEDMQGLPAPKMHPHQHLMNAMKDRGMTRNM